MPSDRAFDPVPPFSGWPIQLIERDLGFGWYVGNATLVTQIFTEYATAHAASTVSDWIDLVLEKHESEIASAGGLLAIHDWRQVKKYASEARSVWFERIKRRPKGYLRKAIVITADNPLLKMAIAGGNLMLAVASGGESTIELATNAYEILRRYRIEAPSK